MRTAFFDDCTSWWGNTGEHSKCISLETLASDNELLHLILLASKCTVSCVFAYYPVPGGRASSLNLIMHCIPTLRWFKLILYTSTVLQNWHI